MNKPEINKSQYVELVNHKMKEHDDYQKGMRIEFVPENSDRPLGTRAVGGEKVEMVASWAEAIIRKEYTLVDAR